MVPVLQLMKQFVKVRCTSEAGIYPKYGVLPAQTKIEQYTTNIDSGQTVRAGEKVYVSSNIYVIEGQKNQY